MDISHFLNAVDAYILNPIIILVFAVAFLIFFWGIFQYVSSDKEGSERDTGKKKIIYGLLGMFIMFSAYGILHIVLGTFGISTPSYISQ